MKSSSFKEVIRLQFNALMMITIKGTLRQKRKLLARRFKQEVLCCEMGEATLNEQGNVDKYSYNISTFPVLHFTVQISDEKISTVLNKLSAKQKAFIHEIPTDKTVWCELPVQGVEVKNCRCGNWCSAKRHHSFHSSCTPFQQYFSQRLSRTCHFAFRHLRSAYT